MWSVPWSWLILLCFWKHCSSGWKFPASVSLPANMGVELDKWSPQTLVQDNYIRGNRCRFSAMVHFDAVLKTNGGVNGGDQEVGHLWFVTPLRIGVIYVVWLIMLLARCVYVSEVL